MQLKSIYGKELIMKRNSSKKKQTKKSIEKQYKKVESTLKWIDIEKITPHAIELKRGSKEMIAVGIKVAPKAIFTETDEVQVHWINRLRGFMNRYTKYELYHPFVYSPVNLDSHLAPFERAIEFAPNDDIAELNEIQIEKHEYFAQVTMDLEFFVMIKVQPKEVEDALHELYNDFSRAGFYCKVLNKIDFNNYISFVFNNSLINDFYFSTNTFGMLRTEEVNEEGEAY